MTVVALARGKADYNLLLVDATSSRAGETLLLDKLFLLYGNTYATAVGEGGALYAAQFLTGWCDPPKRPNFRDVNWFYALLTLLERDREAARRTSEATPPDPKIVTLVVCSRADALYWRAPFDPEAQAFMRPKAPKVLEPGEAILLWGDTGASYPGFSTTPADPFGPMLDAVRTSDARFRKEGNTSIAYPLGERFSGVALPHKSSTPLRRLRPFATPLEERVYAQGGDIEPLLSDRQFMDFDMPKPA